MPNFADEICATIKGALKVVINSYHVFSWHIRDARTHKNGQLKRAELSSIP